MAEEHDDRFMTLWDFVPDPGPMIRDPMWRERELHRLTRPADWKLFPPVKAPAPPPPSDRLTALIDEAGVGRRPSRDVARVEAAIAAALPEDVPSFATEILSVRHGPDGLVSRLRLFDGGLLTLTVSVDGEPAILDCAPEGDQRDFGFLDGVWRRVGEPDG